MTLRSDHVKALQTKVATLENKAALHTTKASQNANAAQDISARITTAQKAQETQRIIELGALSLHHMRQNPDSDYAQINLKLLNQNVRIFRRHLFTEFNIDPEPPPGSNAALKAIASLKRQTAKALKTAQKNFTKHFAAST